jgi:hypothetical protein
VGTTPTATKTATARTHSGACHHPVARPCLFHRDVDDGGRLTGLRDDDMTVEHLGEHQRLARSLLEPPQAHGAVNDHLAGVDRGDPADRHEDPPTRLHLDDDAQHPRRLLGESEQHNNIAHAPDLVAVRVEDGDPCEPRNENFRRRPTHFCRVSPGDGGIRD